MLVLTLLTDTLPAKCYIFHYVNYFMYIELDTVAILNLDTLNTKLYYSGDVSKSAIN